MKKIALSVCSLLFVSMTSLLSLDPVASKVAYVETQKLINTDKVDSTLHEWRDRFNELRKLQEQAEEQVKGNQEKYEKLRKELEEAKKSKLTSADSVKSKEEELMRLQNDISMSVQMIQQGVMQMLQQIQQDIIVKLEKAAKTLREKQGWDLILMVGGLSCSDRVNLTEEIRTLLDKEYDSEKAKKAEPKKEAPKPATEPKKEPAAPVKKEK